MVISTGHELGGEDKTNNTAAATSSGRIILLRSTLLFGGIKGVSTNPGRITETFTPYSRTSSKSDWVNPRTPNFDAEYAAVLACPAFAEIEPMLIIAPLFFSISAG